MYFRKKLHAESRRFDCMHVPRVCVGPAPLRSLSKAVVLEDVHGYEGRALGGPLKEGANSIRELIQPQLARSISDTLQHTFRFALRCCLVSSWHSCPHRHIDFAVIVVR